MINVTKRKWVKWKSKGRERVNEEKYGRERGRGDSNNFV